MNVLLYPASYLKRNCIDEAYLAEAEALEQKGFTTFVFNSETFIHDDFSALKGKTVIYRGWMLTAEEYERLQLRIESFGAVMLTSHEDYIKAHYLPSWVETLKEFTPKTHVFRSVVAAREYIIHHQNEKKTYFIKDFVKSLKTETTSFISDVEQFDTWVNEVEFYKGFVEGGICLRDVEDFVEETELRFFVLKGVLYANSKKRIIPEIVTDVKALIDLPFYSIDVVKNKSGIWRLVEIGDGQVSSSETWCPEIFSELFAAVFK